MNFGPEFSNDEVPTTSERPKLSYWWNKLYSFFSGNAAEQAITDQQHPLYRPFEVLPVEIIQHILSLLPQDKKVYLKLRLVDTQFKTIIDKDTFRHVFVSTNLKEEAKRLELLWAQQADINDLLLNHRAEFESGNVSASFEKAFQLLKNAPENMSYFNLYLRKRAIEQMQHEIAQERNKDNKHYYPHVEELEDEYTQPECHSLFDLDFDFDSDSKMAL